MRDSISSSRSLRSAALLVGACLAIGSIAANATTPQEGGTYQWSAELVSFDKGAHEVTVKARLVETVDTKALPKLSAGDHAMLTWSGLNYAAGIRALERGTQSSYDRLTMPIEYVSADLDGRYIVFKVPVPAADAAAIEKLSAGQWVTATSPLKTMKLMEAVSSIRPYNDVE